MTGALRKLTTIVALDVAGYSARTEADEATSAAEIAVLGQRIAEIAKRHAGRIFNTAGDGFMLEFASTASGLEAAVELGERCVPKVRVGVHMGDVVVQPNGDLLGHGVNVAARLMARAAPGSVVVSADVRRMVRGLPPGRFSSLGVLALDKMAETIEAFVMVATGSWAAPHVANKDEPVLAVLPFDNLSNDPEMQFFSDGVSEEIIQALSRGPTLHVIGRASAFQFRGDRKGEAARALKATHVLDGAVRRSGNRIRITASLTEAANNRLVWTDRYDRDVADAFELQDNIASHVAAALKQTLAAPRSAPSAIDPAAYDLYLQARTILSNGLMEDLVRGEALLAKAASHAPNAADVWALLARIRSHQLPLDHDADGEAARVAANHALRLDPNSGEALIALAVQKPAFAQHEEKLRLAETAYRNAPRDTLVVSAYSALLQIVGRCEAALPLRELGVRMEPLSPTRAVQYALSLGAVDRVDESVAVIEEAWARLPHTPGLIAGRLHTLIGGGRLDEAEAFLGSAELAQLNEGDVRSARSLVSILRMPNEQREKAFRDSPIVRDTKSALNLDFCAVAAHAGCANLAYSLMFDALQSARPITIARIGGGLRGRALAVSPLFDVRYGRALQVDKRFPALCARLGLVEYWRTTNEWPDCATWTPYAFKALCEQAIRGTTELG